MINYVTKSILLYHILSITLYNFGNAEVDTKKY